jgi:putative polymerase
MRLAVSQSDDSLRVGWTTLAGAVVMAAVLFNPFLALVNARVTALGRDHVALVEFLVVAAALGLVALNARRIMLPWIALLAAIVAAGIFFGLINYQMEIRYIRDVLSIPVFILLGMLFVSGNIVRLMIVIQAVVLVVLIYEGIFPREFGETFNIISYYVNTRGFQEAAFWDPDSTLFVSATRPDERFMMGFLDIHRLSSVYLEPVSLGNHVVIYAIFIAAFWRRMTLWQKAFLIASNVLILIGSDGRLAFVTCLMVVGGAFFFHRLPRYSHILYLPLSVLFAALVVSIAGIRSTGDDFPGRVAFSMDMMATLDVAALMGLRQYMSERYLDSGIAYFLATQSIFGVAAIWLMVCALFRQPTRGHVVFIHSVAIYIAFNLLISYSLFSIKTAAILWFIYGYLQAEALDDEWRSAREKPQRHRLAAAA